MKLHWETTDVPDVGKAVTLYPEKPGQLNYQEKLNALASRVIAEFGPAAYDAEICHDDDCPMLRGKAECLCDPEVIVRLNGKVVGRA